MKKMLLKGKIEYVLKDDEGYRKEKKGKHGRSTRSL